MVNDDAAYAQVAYDAIIAAVDVMDLHYDRDMTNAHGLSRAMMDMGAAITYDWCYNLWSEAQRTEIRGHLTDNMDMWPSFGLANVNDPDKNSNWDYVIGVSVTDGVTNASNTVDVTVTQVETTVVVEP